MGNFKSHLFSKRREVLVKQEESNDSISNSSISKSIKSVTTVGQN